MSTTFISRVAIISQPSPGGPLNSYQQVFGNIVSVSGPEHFSCFSSHLTTTRTLTHSTEKFAIFYYVGCKSR